MSRLFRRGLFQFSCPALCDPASEFVDLYRPFQYFAFDVSVARFVRPSSCFSVVNLVLLSFLLSDFCLLYEVCWLACVSTFCLGRVFLFDLFFFPSCCDKALVVSSPPVSPDACHCAVRIS